MTDLTVSMFFCPQNHMCEFLTACGRAAALFGIYAGNCGDYNTANHHGSTGVELKK